MTTKLSVNINKIATLRNARGHNTPSVVEAAIKCQQFGAQGITIHPRPDERHITRADVFDILPHITTEYNIEGYPSNDFIQLVLKANPTQVTLVPDPPEALTSNAGWNTKQHLSFLTDVIGTFQEAGIRTSIFVETDPELMYFAAQTKTNRVELYTEPYANEFHQNKEQAIAPFIRAAEAATEHGLGLNAGHDLSLQNLNFFAQNIPNLLEVSIGHALISDALYFGLENTIQLYLRELRND